MDYVLALGMTTAPERAVAARAQRDRRNPKKKRLPHSIRNEKSGFCHSERREAK
jgi:hypothetical protein